MITQIELLFVQSLQSIFSEYYRNTKSYPAGDRFLYHMVIIELYEPRVTHMKYSEGKLGFF